MVDERTLASTEVGQVLAENALSLASLITDGAQKRALIKLTRLWADVALAALDAADVDGVPGKPPGLT